MVDLTIVNVGGAASGTHTRLSRIYSVAKKWWDIKMLNFKNFALVGALAVFAAGFGATQVEAATCSITDVTVSTACANVDGNDSEDTVDGLFGLDVDFTAKVDAPDTSDGILTVTYDETGKAGTWSVDSWDGFSAAILVTKGGPAFAAYLLDLTAGITGTWSTAGLTNPGGNQPNISHISLYTVEGETPVVPVPAGLPLILSALGLGALTLRRRK